MTTALYWLAVGFAFLCGRWSVQRALCHGEHREYCWALWRRECETRDNQACEGR
jgi:hypothetical protein